MAVDKHSQDAVAKLYAEWVSAGMRLSLAGFTATTKIMEAATQSMVSSRAKAHVGETAKVVTAGAKQDAKPAAVPTLKIVPAAAKPAQPEPSGQLAAASPLQAGTVNAVTDNDLKQISGIGPKLEQMLIRKGITSFAQIAGLGSDDAAKLDAELNLNGRIQRDNWVGQAATLAGKVGGQTWQN